MAWTALESNPGEVKISAPIQRSLGANPATCTVVTGSFSGIKRPGLGVDHPRHSPSGNVQSVLELILPNLLYIFVELFWYVYPS
jgi:hypothetical protein